MKLILKTIKQKYNMKVTQDKSKMKEDELMKYDDEDDEIVEPKYSDEEEEK